MKRICKIFAVLLVMAIALFSFSITAGATEVSNTQDGLVASITSEKDNYKANEDIELTFKVTNTNDFAVENLSLEAIIPNGLTLKNNDNTTVNTVSLGSGESLELTLTAVKESSVITVPIGESTEPPTQTQPVATEATENTTVVQTDSIQTTTTKVNSANSDNTAIKTGNSISYLLVGLICLACLAVAVISFRFRKKAVKYLSLVLCVCIAVGSVAFVGVTNTKAQETSQNMSFEVSKTITLDSEEYKFIGNVVYVKEKENTSDVFLPSSDADLYENEDLFATATDESHIKTDFETKIEYIDNELLLFASSNANEDDILSLIKSYGGTIVGHSNISNSYQIYLNKSYSYNELRNIKKVFEESPFIDSCHLNYPQKLIECYYPVTKIDRWNKDWDTIPSGANWGIEAINAPEAWEYMDSMQNVNIGVFDSGFDINHDDLKNVISNSNYLSALSTNDHGTHVSGIIGAEFENGIGINGVFPKAKLSLIDINTASKLSKRVSTYFDIIATEILISINKCKVVNISLSYENAMIYGASQGNKNVLDHINDKVQSMEKSLCKLINNGYDFVICQAAGNSNDKLFSKNDKEIYGYTQVNLFGENNGCYAKFANVFSAIENEEIKKRIIVVGAIKNKSNNSEKYSLCKFSNIGDRVDVVAPGYEIESTISNNKYKNMNGTSMASPHVAGIAAMLYSLNPNLTGDEVKRIICETATTKVDGYKLVNAEAAVKKVMGQGSLSTSVISSDNNTGLSNVKVEAYLKLKSGTQYVGNTYTDDKGNFSMELQSGSYELRFNKDGYKTTSTTITISKDVMTVLKDPVVMEKEISYNIKELGALIKQEASMNNGNIALKLWVPEDSLELTKKQVSEFENLFKDYADLQIKVIGASKADAATMAIYDRYSAADVYNFAGNFTHELLSKSNLAKVIFSEEVISTNTPESLSTISNNNQLFAYPLTNSQTYILCYNKSVISDSDIKSLENIMSACKASNKKFGTDASNAFSNSMFLFTGGLEPMGFEKDGYTQKFNDYDIDEVTSSVYAFANLFKKYEPYFENNSSENLVKQLGDGTVAAGFIGSWDISKAQTVLGKNAGFSILPTINIDGKDTQIKCFFEYDYLGVNSCSDFPVSSQILAYYLSNSNSQQVRAEKLNLSPTNINVIASDYVKKHSALTSIVNQSHNSINYNAISHTFWPPCEYEIGKYITDFTNDFSYNAIKSQVQNTIINILDA